MNHSLSQNGDSLDCFGLLFSVIGATYVCAAGIFYVIPGGTSGCSRSANACTLKIIIQNEVRRSEE